MSLLRAMQRDVDLIAYGQFSPQRIDRRYAAFWQHPRCGRSSVVFTEGVDASPPDWWNAPEACEIGGLGTPNAVLRDGSPERARGLAVPATGGRLESVGDLLWPGKGARALGTCCLVRFDPCA
jgi:hypothetical protein